MAQEVTEKTKVGTNLTEGPILKTLLVFAIPIVLTSVLQQLYSMVDLMIVGKVVGSVGTVGVNTGGEFADVVAPIPWAFSTAGQIYISQVVGGGNFAKAKKTMGTLLSFMLMLSAVLMVISIVFCVPILELINCPKEALHEAKAYMCIVALGLPFVFGYNGIVGILMGMGESKKPLIFISVAACINIVLDLVFVIVFDMSAAGTAIATMMSQFGSFAAALYYLWKNRERFDFSFCLTYFKIDGAILKELVKLGLPLFVRGVLVRFSMLWVNATANSYGLIVSATNSVGNKLLKFLEVFTQGVDSAGASMIGQNLGAKKVERAGKIPLYTLGSGMVCALCITCISLFAPKLAFGIFTSDPNVLELGVTFMHIMIIHVFVSVVLGSFQTMVTGSGFVSLGMMIGILDGVICKIGLSWLFINFTSLGYLGLFWGVSCSRILPAIICMCYYFSGKWKTRKLLV